MNIHKNNSGFTLVELAIVMVVIGLIVSGVLVGQQLIEQARIRKVISQLNQYDLALNTFRLKYNYYPGDFPYAYRTFGAFSSCTDTMVADDFDPQFVSTSCNGNGNDNINGTNEGLLFWAHLSQAGMIAGSYTGFAASITTDENSIMFADTIYVGGMNMPFIGPHRAIVVPQSDGITSILGYSLQAAEGKSAPGFTSNEAFNIDNKMDDGKPETGAIKAVGDMDDLCDEDGEYKLSNNTISCAVKVRLSIRRAGGGPRVD